MDETKISGDLPNMHIEITRTTEPDGSAEHMTIQLTATPDFRSTLPMLAAFQAPMLAWQAMMAPWMRVMGIEQMPGLPQLGRNETPKQ